jgi:hypothetical protein
MPWRRDDLDTLLRLAGESPTGRQPALVGVLMEIEWAPSLEERLRQIDDRVADLRAVAADVSARVVAHPDMGVSPLPVTPPPAVAREFALLMALETALEKLAATRTGLSRRSR